MDLFFQYEKLEAFKFFKEFKIEVTSWEMSF